MQSPWGWLPPFGCRVWRDSYADLERQDCMRWGPATARCSGIRVCPAYRPRSGALVRWRRRRRITPASICSRTITPGRCLPAETHAACSHGEIASIETSRRHGQRCCAEPTGDSRTCLRVILCCVRNLQLRGRKRLFALLTMPVGISVEMDAPLGSEEQKLLVRDADRARIASRREVRPM